MIIQYFNAEPCIYWLNMRFVNTDSVRVAEINLCRFLEKTVFAGKISNFQVQVFNGCGNQSEGVQAVYVILQVTRFSQCPEAAEQIV